jgi:hypothetical protein
VGRCRRFSRWLHYGACAVNASAIATRICEECGRTFTRTKKLSDAQWVARRFCSHTCAHATRFATPRVDIVTAFLSRVGKTDNCWFWRGVNNNEYGKFYYAKKCYVAHCFALALDGRPVPKGMQGLHHCDNKSCVRPSHLYVGTPKMNGADASLRLRTARGARHYRAKLNPEAVLEMRRQRLQGVSFRQIGHTFNVTDVTTRAAVFGETWKRSAPSNADDLERLKQVRTVYACSRDAGRF